MGQRFSDVIEAALRDARARATAQLPPPRPAYGQGGDGANPGAAVEKNEIAPELAATSHAAVSHSGDDPVTDRSP